MGSGGGGSISQLKHIIFFVQENRSFDSYFGQMGEYRAQLGLSGAVNGTPSGVSLPDYKNTGNVSPYPLPTVCTETISPAWNETHYSINSGKMNNFMKAEGSTPSTIDPQGTRMMGYYDQTDMPYLYELAAQYATSDTWFVPLLRHDSQSDVSFYGDLFRVHPSRISTVRWLDTANDFPRTPTHGISCRYYYQDNSVILANFSDWNTYRGEVYNISHYYTDIQNPSTLPSVIFIERGR